MGANYYRSTNYYSNANLITSTGVTNCCDDPGTYVGPMPATKYCDAFDTCNPNPEVVAALIDDMSCLYHKLIGNPRNYREECMQFECEISRLKQELECCNQCKLELAELLDAKDLELNGTKLELEEISQHTMSLQEVTSTIRDHLHRSDAALYVETEEKGKLEECIQDLEERLRCCCERLQACEIEKDQLLNNCYVHQESIQSKEEDYFALQEELTKHIGEIDCLKNCIEQLKAEINRLNRLSKDLLCEKEQILLDLECDRARDCGVKSCLEEQIENLKGMVECLKSEKEGVCRKCTEIIKLHHTEMNRLTGEADRLTRLYEEEKKAREDLEKKLKDCEDQKAQKLQQSIQNPIATEYHSQISQLRNDCESYRMNINCLEQERSTLQGSKQCVEQQLEIVEAEKNKLQSKLQEVQEMHEVEKMACQSEEDQLVKLQEQIQTTESKEADLKNENEELHMKLQEAETEKATLRYENDNLQEKLQKGCTEKEAINKEIEKLLANLQIAEVIKVNSAKEKNENEVRLRLAETVKVALEEERNQLLLKLEKKEAEARNQILIDSKQQSEGTETEGFPKLKTITDPQFLECTENPVNKSAEDKALELEELRAKCKLEAESHFRRKLDQIKKQMEKQNADVPNENETVTNLRAMNKSLQHDTRKFKKMVNERDEHIVALEEIIKEIKKRFTEQRKQLRMEKIRIQGLQTDLERQEAESHKESEELAKENIRISRERKMVEKEKTKLQEEIKIAEKEKITLQGLAKMKDRIESEVVRLKEAISQQLIDRSELEKVEAEYEAKLYEAKSQFDAQLEMNRQLAEINEFLGKQTQDRALIDTIRDSNENLLRKELKSVSISLKLDTEKLKTLIKERDEEIMSLRKAVEVLKTKYATEAQDREDLMKKVQILSTISHESLQISNSNNNISQDL